MTTVETESRKALGELIDLLREVDERWLSPEWRIESPGDVVDGHRALMHMLQGGLFSHFEDDPAHPVFQRIVSPTRKFTGDNPDAIYYEAAVEAGRSYRVRGNMAGAVYVSITIEAGGALRRFSTHTAGVINDTEFDVGPDLTSDARSGAVLRASDSYIGSESGKLRWTQLLRASKE